MDEILHQELSYAIIGAAMEVHTILGAGYHEKIYQVALEHELMLRKIPFVAQACIQVPYKTIITAEYFVDILVDGKIVVELKALSHLASEHQAQVISYLKATGLRTGLLINFGQASLVHKRVVRRTADEKSV